MIKTTEKILVFLGFLLTLIYTGCMVYVVMWLEALRKGWLV
jgi:hypothetical protein